MSQTRNFKLITISFDPQVHAELHRRKIKISPLLTQLAREYLANHPIVADSSEVVSEW